MPLGQGKNVLNQYTILGIKHSAAVIDNYDSTGWPENFKNNHEEKVYFITWSRNTDVKRE